MAINSRKQFFVYLMTNKNNSVIYTGMTNNLNRRVIEHKNKLLKGFSRSYNIIKLVHFEQFDYVNDAIMREKQIKKWSRRKKLELINSGNKEWVDLSELN